MKLMVSLIRQLQLIGIKTNLESFAITILMEHMLTRNQLPLFLLASKQWGYGNSESTQTFPVKYPKTVIGIYGSKRAINYEYTFAATSITNTNFFMSTRNAEGNSRVIACNWLAIGQ